MLFNPMMPRYDDSLLITFNGVYTAWWENVCGGAGIEPNGEEERSAWDDIRDRGSDAVFSQREF